MKILVPIDFSPSSEKALNFAAQIADALEAKLVLMHILEPVGGDVAFVADYDKMITDANENLDRIVQKSPEQLVNDAQTMVEIGFPTERIIHKVEEEKISLVVMGMENDMSDLDRTVFGSNAYDVIKKNKCAVVTIPATIENTDLKRIMLAVELKDNENIYMLSFLKRLVKHFNSKLFVVHVTAKTHIDLTETNSDAINWITKQLEDVSHQFITINDKNVPEALNYFAEENKMGLMVMSPEKHSFFERLFEGSTTRRTVLHTHVPVLTFPLDY